MGQLVAKAEAAIAKVTALGEKASAIFVEFTPARILADAERVEKLAAKAGGRLPLEGLLVSVKDLYDEASQRTTAGSRLLQDRDTATQDCPIVDRIKAAGGIPFGRTSMSEFAFSGVGLNPHHGTPGNVFDEDRIPGGSTSGGALSVALGLCDIALGTDTGGSVRIPAAVNGLYGFKPSQDAVPAEGIHPLAPTFDTAGPLAADLETTVRAYAVMSASEASITPAPAARRLALPLGAFVNDLDTATARHFEAAAAALEKAGHRLEELDLGFLQDAIGVNRIIVPVEAYRIYNQDLERLETLGDPRVLKRIRFGETLSTAEIEEAYGLRAETVRRFDAALAGYDALIAPTLRTEPPTIAETEAEFDRCNAAMLRNTSLLNLADACALSMPLRKTADQPGDRPGALMLAAPKGQDWPLLDLARQLDALDL
ncbi:glutamyl-tRNA amidotransferase [Pelagibius litoralis]|uniref:Glutamyl-tRNA amidotransferase n=1 Tax=Pelagibius litoralis TaxID=374515 RepID=A0A967KE86_9PROT|nr:amidase family protein [Pelagibius litoralis]NIA70620.1 glutamyl-tRNA amidotransferase [Pelagibius litoralis]